MRLVIVSHKTHLPSTDAEKYRNWAVRWTLGNLTLPPPVGCPLPQFDEYFFGSDYRIQSHAGPAHAK